MEDLDDLYENAPCGYVSLAADGVIVKVNRTLAGWLGTQSFELLGKRFYDLLNVPGKIFYETHLLLCCECRGTSMKSHWTSSVRTGGSCLFWPMRPNADRATEVFSLRA
ncbi:PAS domain-containing protein [Rhizobium sophoriradicis]|uniref:PAS domain-containing protein n=1 Tax=Rhizobium sophoriradicis TaxID=1535245 RepID=UPI0026A6BEBA